MSKTKHIIEPGECISSLAVEYGFTWDQIWDDSGNSKLKKLRENPNVLMPGDVVKIPKKKKKEKKKGTGGKHDFKRNKEQSKLKIQLLVAGEPIKSQPCRLEVEGVPDRMGQVDNDGNVAIEGETEFTISSKVTFANLYVGEEPKVSVYALSIGYLNPLDEVTGIQQRLNNLGFECGANDGVVGPKTEASIKQFQRENELVEDGQPSETVQSKLEEIHGV